MSEPLPLLVLFGAGNIGRGFIAPLFSASGWRVCFVDIDKARIEAIHQRSAYTVTEVTNTSRQERQVCPVDGIMATDTETVATLVADADLVATAVGLGALPHLGPNLAAGLQQRWAQEVRPLDILVCENGIQATDILREAISSKADATTQAQLDQGLGCVRTSIGRMIPPPGPGADLLDSTVEPYARLPLEAAAFRGPAPTSVSGVVLADDFDLVLRQKLYIHNLSHACCAYAGHLRGYRDLPSCVADPKLTAGVRAAVAEVAEALGKAHGKDEEHRAAITSECITLLDDLLDRYANTALGDSVARVARDPIRKLGPDDRLIGAARLCLSHGIQPRHLAKHILAACAYTPQADEPQAERFTQLQALGWRQQLASIAELKQEEALMTTLDIAARQREAADLIDQAGIHLHEEEVNGIEIADFGLGRYEEMGLAILVYVNTDRCCAKELAMLPGQICPEHKHPPIDGDPGKEETFRVREGEVHMFLPGHRRGDEEAIAFGRSFIPDDKYDAFTIFKHTLLKKGDQLTLKPNTPHWFVAGAQGAVVSEFSTRSRDEADIFTDQEIQRVPDDE